MDKNDVGEPKDHKKGHEQFLGETIDGRYTIAKESSALLRPTRNSFVFSC